MESSNLLKNFIVLEGIDGSGTTTQLGLLSKRLGAIPHFATAEPSNGPAGRLIRSVLGAKESMSAEGLAYLFACDRNEHVYSSGGIVERLQLGEIVISDRYLFSSLAYQGLSCGMELAHFLNSRFPLPEYLFFLEIDAESAKTRISTRESLEIFEELPFQKRVEAAYRSVISTFADSGMKIHILDAKLKSERICDMIFKTIMQGK